MLTAELSKSMLDILDEPSTRLRIADQLAKFARYLMDADEFDDAVPLLNASLTVRTEQLPKNWHTFDTQSLLGEALFQQKKFAESEPKLLAGYRGMRDEKEKIPPHLKSRLTEALQRLVNLYEAWHAGEPEQGHNAKAKQWQQTLDEHISQLESDN